MQRLKASVVLLLAVLSTAVTSVHGQNLRHRQRLRKSVKLARFDTITSSDYSDYATTRKDRKLKSNGCSKGKSKGTITFLDPNIESRPYINCIPLEDASGKSSKGKGRNNRLGVRRWRSTRGKGSGFTNRAREIVRARDVDERCLPYCPPGGTDFPTATPLPTITAFPYTRFPTFEPVPTRSSEPSVAPTPTSGPTTAGPTPVPATPRPTIAATTTAPTKKGATNAPTASGPTTRYFPLQINYQLWPGTTMRDSTVAEDNGVNAKTVNFFDDFFAAQYSTFVPLSFFIFNSQWMYDANAADGYPNWVEIVGQATFTTPDALTPSADAIYNKIIASADTFTYVFGYVVNADPSNSLFKDTYDAYWNYGSLTAPRSFSGLSELRANPPGSLPNLEDTGGTEEDEEPRVFQDQSQILVDEGKDPMTSAPSSHAPTSVFQAKYQAWLNEIQGSAAAPAATSSEPSMSPVSQEFQEFKAWLEKDEKAKTPVPTTFAPTTSAPIVPVVEPAGSPITQEFQAFQAWLDKSKEAAPAPAPTSAVLIEETKGATSASIAPVEEEAKVASVAATAASIAPATSTTRTVPSRLGYGFFAFTTVRQPTTEELAGLLDATESFYKDILAAAYPDGTFKAFTMTNIVETFDAAASLPVIYDFVAEVTFASDNASTPTSAQVFRVMDNANLQAYIMTYVQNAEPSATSLFMDTQRVGFGTTGQAM